MEITEKWLGEIGGWQVMKTARGLVDAGLASVTSAEEGLIRGIVGSGRMRFTAGLRIRSRSDVENLCTCPAARRGGLMCEHALAVVLMHLRADTPPKKKETAVVPAPPPRVEEVGAASVPGRYAVFLPAGMLQGSVREPMGVLLRYEAGGEAETSLLVGWLAAQRLAQSQSLPLTLRGEALDTFLRALAEHPRVFAGRPDGGECSLRVAALPLRPLLVVERVAGTQELRLRLEEGKWQAVLGHWWLCRETRVLFQLAVGTSELAALNAELARVGEARRTLRWLVGQGTGLGEIFQLEMRGELERFHVMPVPCVFELQIEGSMQTVEARLSASYGTQRWQVRTDGADDESTTNIFPISDPARSELFYMRNRADEARLVQRLTMLDFQVETARTWRLQGAEEVTRFFASGLSLLKEVATVVEGERWRAATRGVQRIVPQTRFAAGSGQSGGDWLGMEIAYEAGDGFRLPRAEVLRLIRSGRRSLQAQGRRYVLDAAAVDELEESLRDVPLELTPEGARVHAAHAAYFGGGGEFDTGAAAETRVRAEIGELATRLRPYQLEGVLWMTSRIQRGCGGVLADEMGLGKTVQSIALTVCVLQERSRGTGPVLVVCPKSLLGNWQAEFERFAPQLKVLSVQGAGRAGALAEIASADVVITSYQLLVRDVAAYQAEKLSLILLDEASFIRNPGTEAAKALRSLKASGRVALTGTPLENGVRDLWSIFQFVLPGYLGSQDSFRERFESPVHAGLDLPAGRDAAARLQKLTKPYFLRRTKRQVLKDLPEKIEQVLWCTPSAAQAEFYRRILEEGRDEIQAARRRSGQNGARMTMFTVLLRLRQACCDLRLTGIRSEVIATLGAEDLSGKWPALVDQIMTALEAGGKVLVFSQFVQFLRLMRSEFEEREIGYAYLDGSSQDRTAQVERFQKDPDCRVFLISLKAGGYGLNLTAADSVILADPWWNPAVEAQAIDRAHRIGQQKVVNAYRLIMRGTVEERILKLQERKRSLVEAALNDQAPMMEGLNEKDLEDLVLRP